MAVQKEAGRGQNGLARSKYPSRNVYIIMTTSMWLHVLAQVFHNVKVIKRQFA
jgi:hypothetical protein